MDPLNFPQQCPDIDNSSRGTFGSFNYIANGDEKMGEDVSMIQAELNGILRGYIPVEEQGWRERPFKYIRRISDIRRVAELNAEHNMLQIVTDGGNNQDVHVRSDFYPINYIQAALNASNMLWELTRAAQIARNENRYVPPMPHLENFIVTPDESGKFVINTILNSNAITLTELQAFFPHLLSIQAIQLIMSKILMSLQYLHAFQPGQVYCVYLSLCPESIQVSVDQQQGIITEIVLTEFANAKLVPDRPLRMEFYFPELKEIMFGLYSPATDFDGFLPPEFCDGMYLGNNPQQYDIRSIDMWMAGMIMLRLISIHYNPFPPMGNFLNSSLFYTLINSQVYDIMLGQYGHLIGRDGVDLLVRLLRPNASERITAHQSIHHPFIAHFAPPGMPPAPPVAPVVPPVVAGGVVQPPQIPVEFDFDGVDMEMDGILDIDTSAL